MTLVRLFFTSYGGRLFKLAIYLIGENLPPDYADVAALREIISRLSAALGHKVTTTSTEIVASGGVNITATGSPYSDDQDKFRPGEAVRQRKVNSPPPPNES